MAKIKISYNKKDIEKEEVVPGLVKAGNAYLVKCSVSGEWTYCNQERLDKLSAKYGSVENVGTQYVGRIGKRTQKAAVVAATPAVAGESTATDVVADQSAGEAV